MTGRINGWNSDRTRTPRAKNLSPNEFWRADGSFGKVKNDRRGIVYQHNKACKEVAWTEERAREAAPEDAEWWMQKHRTACASLRHNQRKLFAFDNDGIVLSDKEAPRYLSQKEVEWAGLLKKWEEDQAEEQREKQAASAPSEEPV